MWYFKMKIFSSTSRGVVGADGVSCREIGISVHRGTSAKTPADLQYCSGFPFV